MKKLLILTLLTLPLYTNAKDSLDLMCPKYISEKDYISAFKACKKEAKNNNPYAQREMGNMYYEGKTVPVNYKKAFEWYKKAARQGSADAMYNLAVCYANGQGTTKSYRMAYNWYESAALKGHIDAQYRLGAMSALGQGVDKDFNTARDWYTKAAEQGHFKAARILSAMYYKGDEIPKDEAQAVKWAEAAANYGDDGQMYLLTAYYFAGGKGMEANHEKAFKYFTLAEKKGESKATVPLGIMHQKGQGTPKDLNKAAEYFQKAINSKNLEPVIMLSRVYEEKTDYETAMQWLLISYQFLKDKQIYELKDYHTELEKKLTQKQMESARQKAKLWVTEYKEK